MPNSRLRVAPNGAGLVAVALFFAAVVALMQRRHFFDDETINVFLLQTKSVGQLYRFAQRQDVHPPLSYVFNGITYQLIRSFNSILWVNACLIAWALFAFVRKVAERANSDISRIAVAAGCALNPSILLWGVSLRWYSYWIPLAMALFVVLFLSPRKRSTLPVAGAIAVLSFYVGYLTAMYVIVLIAVEWLNHGIKISKRLLIIAGICIAAVLPQCYYLVTVHIPQGKGQSSHNLVKLLGSAGIGTFVGPLVFPVSPFAIAFALASVVVTLWIVFKEYSSTGRDSRLLNLRSMSPIILTTAGLFAVEVVSGIAIKERNLAIASVLLFAWIPTRWTLLPKTAAYAFLVLWGGFLAKSTLDVVRQSDTGKASVNIPIADLRREIISDENRFGVDDPHCWLFTYDKIATCYGSLWNMHLASPLALGVEHQGDSHDYHIPKGTLVVALKTEQGSQSQSGLRETKRVIDSLLAAMKEPRSVKLGYDKYHAFESKMTDAVFPAFQIEYFSGVTQTDLHVHWQGDPGTSDE